MKTTDKHLSQITLILLLAMALALTALAGALVHKAYAFDGASTSKAVVVERLGVLAGGEKDGGDDTDIVEILDDTGDKTEGYEGNVALNDDLDCEDDSDEDDGDEAAGESDDDSDGDSDDESDDFDEEPLDEGDDSDDDYLDEDFYYLDEDEPDSDLDDDEEGDSDEGEDGDSEDDIWDEDDELDGDLDEEDDDFDGDDDEYWGDDDEYWDDDDEYWDEGDEYWDEGDEYWDEDDEYWDEDADDSDDLGDYDFEYLDAIPDGEDGVMQVTSDARIMAKGTDMPLTAPSPQSNAPEAGKALKDEPAEVATGAMRAADDDEPLSAGVADEGAAYWAYNGEASWSDGWAPAVEYASYDDDSLGYGEDQTIGEIETVQPAATAAENASSALRVLVGKPYFMTRAMHLVMGVQVFKNVIKVHGAIGDVTFENTSKNLVARGFQIDDDGTIVVPKGTPQGTYVVHVKVVDSGAEGDEPAAKTVAFAAKVA